MTDKRNEILWEPPVKTDLTEASVVLHKRDGQWYGEYTVGLDPKDISMLCGELGILRLYLEGRFAPLNTPDDATNAS